MIDFDTRKILLGYYEPTGVYLAADVDKHRRPGGKSNAVQTRKEHLDAAYRDGMSAFKKSGNGEIAVVVRGDMIGTYLLDAEAMHQAGVTTAGLKRFNDFAKLTGGPTAVPPILRPRNKSEATILRTFRNRNFRQRVLTAYEHCCCVCSMQLEMAEAAHL